VIVGVVGRAPDRVQRGFAGALDATTPVFHKVNYWGSCAGAEMAGPARADVWLACMSLTEVYHHATVHFDHHRRQLTLGDESAER
jgi:hypothetical protein